MADLDTINANDLLEGTSRTKINDNFTDLNTAKVEVGGVQGTPARGDILVGKNASPTWEKLTIGTAGKVLRSDGTDPVWANDTGWQEAGETWAYSSVDDPTGVITVPTNATTKYSVGMRIRFVNGGNTIYGIITAVAATTITFCHEIDPSDDLALTLLANSAITVPFYSVVKTPFGFPSDPRKWTILKPFTLSDSQASPNTNTWYNLGTPTIDLPIGSWNVMYGAGIRQVAAGATYGVETTLSTANNSESDSEMTAGCGIDSTSGGSGLWLTAQKHIVVASKTTHYLNFRSTTSTPTSLAWNNKQRIQATLGYL